jgi:hypothetical protein
MTGAESEAGRERGHEVTAVMPGLATGKRRPSVGRTRVTRWRAIGGWRQSPQTFAAQTHEGPAMIAALWLVVVRWRDMGSKLVERLDYDQNFSRQHRVDESLFSEHCVIIAAGSIAGDKTSVQSGSWGLARYG